MSESYRVLKFGGSSVGAPERIARVLHLIARERAQGPVAVVASAMADTTDWLLEAVATAASGDTEGAQKIVTNIETLAIQNGEEAYALISKERTMGPKPDFQKVVLDLSADLRKVLHGISLIREHSAQTVDQVLSYGERISNNVLALLATAAGLPAVYQDAREYVVTNDRFGNALVDWPATAARIQNAAAKWEGKIPFNTGFLGATPEGVTTTLGRNGSDYTAALLGRGLQALEVQIWTDVSGVMTADPNIVREA